MIRLHITVEGLTEQRFVKEVLAKHLANKSVYVDARQVLTSKDKRTGCVHRGGFRRTGTYETVKKDICAWMREDRRPDARFTTMFDLYGLPRDFPGYAEAAKHLRDPYTRVTVLEQALRHDIQHALDGDNRFLPYIQLHEFEALILADPRQLVSEYLEHKQQIEDIAAMVDKEGGNPELIDDGDETAPSKRIIAHIREYDGNKPTVGPLIVGQIGLTTLRRKCAHFAAWLDLLEKLGEPLPEKVL